MKSLETLKEELTEALKDMDIIVCSVKEEKKGKYLFLTVELDKALGIDLDTIVEATHIVNPIVDKYDDIFEGEYILDVISKERGN